MKHLIISLIMAVSLFATTAPKSHTAGITETMNAGGYTYMKVSEGTQTYWVAVTATPVSVGQRVTFNEQMWMPNFKSRALNRTFDKILFATMAHSSAHHPNVAAVKPANAPQQVMTKAPGGYTVTEVFEKRAALKGKTVSVRGKVTKVSRGIMKRNWVHLEDGTGSAATDDLVFTSPRNIGVQAGDTVIATGTVETDKDFGYGYFYPVIIEQSSFAKE
ncbi:MAG TPA: DNA-binding protein [Sulfuricurvum sp.]|nr:DNA-binding protein [Sulfuricurvum sp.]